MSNRLILPNVAVKDRSQSKGQTVDIEGTSSSTNRNAETKHSSTSRFKTKASLPKMDSKIINNIERAKSRSDSEKIRDHSHPPVADFNGPEQLKKF